MYHTKKKAYTELILLLLVVLFFLITSTCNSQCPNDICSNAIQVENQSPEQFCNYDCSEDFDLSWDGNWNFPTYPCEYMNYDMWYVIEVEVGGSVQFHIESDYNTIDEIGDDGEYEGVTMGIWEGGDCNSVDFIWGTQCYWFTDELYFINPPQFDPSRTEWDFVIDLVPGTYYINIDGFGYSVGCGEWWWSEPFFLGTNITESVKILQVKTGQKFNVLGQQIK